METLEYKGGPNKISRYILRELPFLNYAAVRKLLRKGDVRVNGAKVYDDAALDIGDVLTVFCKRETYIPDVIYQDGNIAVFYKPVKMLSEGENSLETAVKVINPEYILCHRLDTNTQGLIMFAKNVDAFNAVKLAFKKHEIKKFYRALLYGTVEKQAVYNGYLVKDAQKSTVKIYKNKVPGSVKITTAVTPIEKTEDTTLAEIELITGRTHQIRAHLASLGHFVIGDGKYGREEINNRFKTHIQALSACRLEFSITDPALSYLNAVKIELPPSYRLI